MKKTKELENEETSVSMDKILKIESLEDAKEFERVASGRKFCKKGTRVQDICEEEVENYICKTRGNLLHWLLCFLIKVFLYSFSFFCASTILIISCLHRRKR